MLHALTYYRPHWGGHAQWPPWGGGSSNAGTFPLAASVGPRITPASPSAELVPTKGGQALITVGQKDRRVDPSSCLRHALGLQTWGVKVRLLRVSLSPKTYRLGTLRGQSHVARG